MLSASTKFSVDLTTTASATVTVTLTNEQYNDIAADLGVEVKDLTVTDVRDAVIEQAYNNGAPGLCASCSGWGRDFGLDLGDEWDVVPDGDVKEDSYKSVRLAHKQ